MKLKKYTFHVTGRDGAVRKRDLVINVEDVKWCCKEMSEVNGGSVSAYAEVDGQRVMVYTYPEPEGK